MSANVTRSVEWFAGNEFPGAEFQVVYGEQAAGCVVPPDKIGATNIEFAHADAFDGQFAGAFLGRDGLVGLGIAVGDVLPVVKAGGVLGKVQRKPMQVHAVNGDAAAQ